MNENSFNIHEQSLIT